MSERRRKSFSGGSNCVYDGEREIAAGSAKEESSDESDNMIYSGSAKDRAS